MSEDELEPEPRPKQRVPKGDWHHPRRRTRDNVHADAHDVEFRSRDELRSAPGPATTSGALIAYRCGAIGLIPGLGAVLGPIALIVGFFSLRYLKKHPTAKGTGHAVAGIVLGLFATIISWVIILVILAMISASNVHK
jgi:hypothetical protein